MRFGAWRAGRGLLVGEGREIRCFDGGLLLRRKRLRNDEGRRVGSLDW